MEKEKIINEVVEMMVKEQLTLGDIEKAYFHRLDNPPVDDIDMSGADGANSGDR